jgi:hypothetical protein
VTVLDRAREWAEDSFGFRVLDVDRAEALEEAAERLGFFIDEAETLAYSVADLFAGRPNEMRPERRNRLAQRSRKALREDPLARAEATLLSNFSFGRGVSKPQAVSEKVQEVIDEAWTDPVNLQKLTSFEAQRHRSNELLTQANLYPIAFIRNGAVRVGFIDADLIVEVVCDPDDDEMPYYYVGRKPRLTWNFRTHQYEVDEGLADGIPKTVYWEHWRNVEDATRDAEENNESAPEGPEDEALQEGKVFHVRINRIGRTQFGTPPWAAVLRFFSAMNELTTAHVAMAQAASSWVAKTTSKGGPRAVVDSANAILAQTGELASARFGQGGVGEPQGTVARKFAAPPSPGGLWNENESLRLEAMNLSSGAGQMAQTAQIVRAPIAAAAQFGQHYLGDASNANLATATSLELPSLMNIQAWQETFEGLFRWFTDLAIQEAARAGRLGGLSERLTESEAEERFGRPRTKAEKLPLSRLRLAEADERAEMERRLGEDLTYTFEMPYPGRRNLPDVVSAVATMATAYDPAGVNIPLRRALLYFFAKDGLGVDDPAKLVDDVIPEDALSLPGAMLPGTPGGPRPSEDLPPEDERSQYGERTPGGARGGSERAEKRVSEAFLDDASREAVRRIEEDLDGVWKRMVADPAVMAAIAASSGAARNGKEKAHV